jgi:hypothetical protein
MGERKPMSHFYRKKLNAQGKYINPPVHAKPKINKRLLVSGTETKLYKFERGPLKETSTERSIRIAKEAEERYYARQAEKEAGKMFKRKTAEEKRVIAEAKRKAYYAVQKEKFIANLAKQKALDDKEAERQKAKDDEKSAGQKRWAEVREMRRLQIANRPKRGAPKGKYKRSDATKRLMSESAKLRWARLREKAKSTSFVITITITDPNKS